MASRTSNGFFSNSASIALRSAGFTSERKPLRSAKIETVREVKLYYQGFKK